MFVFSFIKHLKQTLQNVMSENRTKNKDFFDKDFFTIKLPSKGGVKFWTRVEGCKAHILPTNTPTANVIREIKKNMKSYH